MCVQSPQRQKRKLDSLELALQTVVSYHVGAGIQAQVLWENSMHS